MLEVIHAAELMGIDPISEPELVWLAEEAIRLELPIGWELIELSEGGAYYHNAVLGLTQWQHPKLTWLIALVRTFHARKRELPAAGAAPAE